MTHMNKSRKAFTLVELLISILVMFIIIGTVVMTGKAGMELFQKAQQNALVTNGLRMTLTSFNREIVPKLDNTTLVEILANNSDMPQTLPSSFDHYIYMQDGAIFHWDANKKEQLAGSEYISSLAFPCLKYPMTTT